MSNDDVAVVDKMIVVPYQRNSLQRLTVFCAKKEKKDADAVSSPTSILRKLYKNTKKEIGSYETEDIYKQL